MSDLFKKHDPIATVVDDSDSTRIKVDFRNISTRDFLNYLMLNSMKGDDVERAFPIKNKETGERDLASAEVCLVVNGHYIDVYPTLKRMHETFEANVQTEARAMYEDKLDGSKLEQLARLVEKFEYEMRQEARKLFPLSWQSDED